MTYTGFKFFNFINTSTLIPFVFAYVFIIGHEIIDYIVFMGFIGLGMGLGNFIP